jgi:hypothetical protein
MNNLLNLRKSVDNSKVIPEFSTGLSTGFPGGFAPPENNFSAGFFLPEFVRFLP